jgi:hypothetical protein
MSFGVQLLDPSWSCVQNSFNGLDSFIAASAPREWIYAGKADTVRVRFVESTTSLVLSRIHTVVRKGAERQQRTRRKQERERESMYGHRVWSRESVPKKASALDSAIWNLLRKRVRTHLRF